MPYHRLSTSKIAKATGVHPNTVRLYEKWGFIAPVQRSAAGYRLYTNVHLDQMRLARLALGGGFPGRTIRRSLIEMIRQCARGDLGGALERAYNHLALVQSELAQAEIAAQLLQRWAEGIATEVIFKPLRIGETAHRLGLTTDALRNWERNGLLRVPRDERSGYRLYTQVEISRLRVIRMLRTAGYSVMAILRMLLQLDQGYQGDLRQALDTPRTDEDVYYAADRWLSTLREQAMRAGQIIAHLEGMIANHHL
jgi:DNA-binding transcriptional MerR regulator